MTSQLSLLLTVVRRAAALGMLLKLAKHSLKLLSAHAGWIVPSDLSCNLHSYYSQSLGLPA